MTYREALIKVAQAAQQQQRQPRVQPSPALMRAIRVIESGDGSNLYGDWIAGKDRSDRSNARAWGPYQQHKINVDDANRILGTSYTYDDRLDDAKSEAMVRAEMEHYGNMKGVTPSDETFARIHNGGPNGWRRTSTQAYWDKVKPELERQTAIIQAQQAAAAKTQAATQTPQPQQQQPIRQAPPAAPKAQVQAPKQPVGAAQPATPAAPVAPAQPTAPAKPATYTVNEGDTLWGMWKNRTDKSEKWPAFQTRMQTANPNVNFGKLMPGQQLNLK